LSSRNTPFVALVDRLRREHPEISDPEQAITAGNVRVDGVIASNPRALVRRHGHLAVVPSRVLRGTVKLQHALEGFGLQIGGLVAADIGASTGGFTTALLEAGARRVYAIDAGHGQLLGSLRQDHRVVNLEATNLGALTASTVPETIEIMTIDLSYLALSDALPQLEVLTFGPRAVLVALVKPMYELGLATPPTEPFVLAHAVRRAHAGVERAPWTVRGTRRSPVTGRRGAIEFLVWAQRAEGTNRRPLSSR
jgi:23S rRNA (cytidine1920-2'-O)/16S rRNA (cytidine1409-2'-O)-methyltransferase